MKKLLSILALVTAVGFGFTANSFAEDAAPTVDKAAVVAPVAATPEAAPAAAAVVAPVLVPNKGDTAWMIMATVLVLLMCVPGLGLFYGGMVRQKNMLSVLMQTFMITWAAVSFGFGLFLDFLGLLCGKFILDFDP